VALRRQCLPTRPPASGSSRGSRRCGAGRYSHSPRLASCVQCRSSGDGSGPWRIASMRFLRRRIGWRRAVRCAGTGIALVAYLFATIGFPMPTATARTAGTASGVQTSPCGCCGAGASCCCAGKRQAPAPCCVRPRPSGAAPATLVWVGGPAAMGCRGASTIWIACGAVTPPPPAVTWEPHPPAGDWLTLAADRPLGPALVPPDPPPRCTHS
jgi:hypothetical protein